MRVVGLDVSTYVGMFLASSVKGAETGGESEEDRGEDRGKVIHFPKLKSWNRLQLIAHEVKRTLEIWKPQRVVIESYAYGNRYTLVTLVEVGTVVREVLWGMSVPWYEVPPSVLKMFTTGKGSAKKQDMKVAVKARWGFESPSDDITDAFALARMGQLEEMKLLGIKGVARGG